MTPTDDTVPPLPEWGPLLEISDSALERFIYCNEPAGSEAADEFRADLSAALSEVARAYATKAIAQAVAQEREQWAAAAALAIEALEWHACGHCEDSMPQDTVDALAALRIRLGIVSAIRASCAPADQSARKDEQ